jgi:hypothetical protein
MAHKKESGIAPTKTKLDALERFKKELAKIK